MKFYGFLVLFQSPSISLVTQFMAILQFFPVCKTLIITHGGSTMSLNLCYVFWFNTVNWFILNWGFLGLFCFGEGVRVAHWRWRVLAAWLAVWPRSNSGSNSVLTSFWAMQSHVVTSKWHIYFFSSSYSFWQCIWSCLGWVF